MVNLFPREVPRVLNLFPRGLIESTPKNFPNANLKLHQRPDLAEDAAEGLPEEYPEGTLNQLSWEQRGTPSPRKPVYKRTLAMFLGT